VKSFARVSVAAVFIGFLGASLMRKAFTDTVTGAIASTVVVSGGGVIAVACGGVALLVAGRYDGKGVRALAWWGLGLGLATVGMVVTSFVRAFTR
jgi:uncharacterized membrane protein